MMTVMLSSLLNVLRAGQSICAVFPKVNRLQNKPSFRAEKYLFKATR